MNAFLNLLDQKPYILADGATGTNLFTMGLETGDAPEPWNITHPDRIRSLHQQFVDAGSDLILTNSFGGTSFRLKLHGFEDQVYQLNKAAGEIAREVADNSNRPIIVGGSMGPTGEMIVPHGEMTHEQAVTAYQEQARGLQAGGVDVFWLETLYAKEELAAAMEALSDFDLPICATMSFDTAGRTMMGLTPKDLASVAPDLGLSAFGANCGVGASDLLATTSSFHQNASDDAVIIAKANCGIPSYQEGEIVYSGTEALMADYVQLALDAGARIVGGCCGTRFSHIAAMRKAMDNYQPGSAPDVADIEAKVGAMSDGSKRIFAGNTSIPTKRRRRR